MDAFVSLVGALAWPLVVLTIALVFRQELRGAIGRISHVKYKDIEASFEQKLREAEIRAEAVLPPPVVEVPQIALPEPADDRLNRLITVSPRAAVVEAWFGVEQALRNASAASGVADSDRKNQHQLMRELLASRSINPEIEATYEDLRALRNAAAHSQDFDLPPMEAERYVELARGVAGYFTFVAQRAGDHTLEVK